MPCFIRLFYFFVVCRDYLIRHYLIRHYLTRQFFIRQFFGNTGIVTATASITKVIDGLRGCYVAAKP